jgi:hypothetical protein
MKKYLLAFCILVLLFNCTNSKSKKDTSNEIKSQVQKDTTSIIKDALNQGSVPLKFTLHDSLFKFKNIESTEFLRRTRIESLTPLDSFQKRILIKPFVRYFKDQLEAWDARFISKQNKIGDYQPIIMYLLTTDYLAIWLMILNKDLEPISYVIIGGQGDHTEPEISEKDSTYKDLPIKYCDFKDNQIILHSIVATVNYKNEKKQSLIDSTNYQITLNSEGKINVLKINGFQYYRLYKGTERNEYWRER